MCTICKAQTVGTGISVGHATLSSGTEVNACCDKNDNLLEVQVEGNTDYVEVFIIKNGEVEDYDITYITNETISFNIEPTGKYLIYVRTEDDSDYIIFDNEEM